MFHSGQTPYNPLNNWLPPGANRRHKDTVFRDLFGTEENKANALKLYNALAGTAYDDPAALTLTTLDDVIYMNVKNDVSFIIDSQMVLWEHQSTVNPNMPLRDLVYFAKLYSAFLGADWKKVYESTRVPLPTPRFTVFYNGLADEPGTKVLRLSDSFAGADADVEVTATVVNVNLGANPQLETASPTLAGYATLVDFIRRYKENSDIDTAVDKAVQECVERSILSGYLSRKRAEVVSMFMTEWDEEHERKLREHMRQRAIKEGLEEGRKKGLE